MNWFIEARVRAWLAIDRIDECGAGRLLHEELALLGHVREDLQQSSHAEAMSNFCAFVKSLEHYLEVPIGLGGEAVGKDHALGLNAV